MGTLARSERGFKPLRDGCLKFVGFDTGHLGHHAEFDLDGDLGFRNGHAARGTSAFEFSTRTLPFNLKAVFCEFSFEGRKSGSSAFGPEGMGLGDPNRAHFSFFSTNSTCLRTLGSYFLSRSLSVMVRRFLLVT